MIEILLIIACVAIYLLIRGGYVIICMLLRLIMIMMFYPKVNSVISIIWLVLCGIRALTTASMIGVIIVTLSIADCIRDICIGEKYYIHADVEFREFDPLFIFKSLTALFTFGFSRAIFLIFIYPCYSFDSHSFIKQRLRCGQPLPHPSNICHKIRFRYYYSHIIERLEKRKIIVSNIDTVDSEWVIREKKFRDIYYANASQRSVNEALLRAALGKRRKQRDQKHDKDLDKLYFHRRENHYAYISRKLFEKYPKLLLNVLSNKGGYSSSDIRYLQELAPLHLNEPLDFCDADENEWSEYFIIQAMKPLVEAGVFEDEDLSDKDPFDTHVYHYRGGTTSQKVINADDDPRFFIT